MANINMIEDEQGQIIDLEYFCSDYCAKTSDNYKGWYGCVEVEEDNKQKCFNPRCNNLVG